MPSVPHLVESNADSKPYWEAAKAGRLVFKKCLDCGYVQFPPRYLCPKCWSEKAQWMPSQGLGSVHSFSVVHRAPTLEHGAKVPYVLAMIEVIDAARMVANIVGDDALNVNIGDPVTVTFEPWADGALPQFRRVLK